MEQLKQQAESLSGAAHQAAEKIGIPQLVSEKADLVEVMSKPDFWEYSTEAGVVSQHHATLARRVDPWVNLLKDIDELKQLTGLEDSSLTIELEVQLKDLNLRFNDLKKELRFLGPYDDHDVILSIHAGAGGTDAQDWAQMLLRMYSRWALAHDITVDVVDQTAGEEAGLKSVTLELAGGGFLYGRLKGEQGVHRLVRLSPFNSDNLRQTSFAKVEILPRINKPDQVEIDEKDLKVDVYRAGGHGGQSVNTTDSAVRVTHIPTGISVAIQNERSQLQNREAAMTILRSRLAALQLEQHAENLEELKGPNQSAEWGSQIRSYVLHPYSMVKDLRTRHQTSDAQGVLDGLIDPFIDEYLEHSLASIN